MLFSRHENIPLELLGQCHNDYSRKRSYTKAKTIESLAIGKCKRNGNGITFNDLIHSGLAKNKFDAQRILKYSLRKGTLFTCANQKPQRYYPSNLRSEILKKMDSKNIPVRPTGLTQRKPTHNIEAIKQYDQHINQTLEGFVLPLLPSIPLHIHNIQLKLRISKEYYQETLLPHSRWNGGKEHEQIIGKSHVKYRFYPNGSIIISIESSNNPFRLEDGTDFSCLMAYLGQVRDRLIIFLSDSHERIVPNLMDWELKECDINKDIIVSDWLQLIGLKIQIKHCDHLFRVYFKSMCENTVCRVEETSSPRKPLIQAINDILNPTERIEKRLDSLEKVIKRAVLGLSGNFSDKDVSSEEARSY